MIQRTTQIDQWHGCYDEGWKGLIVDEAFAHPAKISYALAGRIYEHAFKHGWVKPGDRVVDPFGGIGGTAIHAACHGLQWLGCELEPRFHGMANRNFDLWARKFGMLPEWVQPVMHCGDSRRLAEVLGLADLCFSSPPYSSGEKGHPSLGSVNNDDWGHDGRDITRRRGKTGEYGDTGGQLGSMPEGDVAAVLSSPPYAGDSGKGDRTGHERAARRADETGYRQGLGCFKTSEAYGRTDGQLGGMVEGTPPAAIVSSPPYAAGTVHDGNGIDQSKLTGNKAGKNSQAKAEGYGETSGQLGAMVVGSPPFESVEGANSARKFKADPAEIARKRSEGYASGELKGNYASPEAIERSIRKANEQVYGDSDGNIGNDTGETFWSAAHIIVAQCYQILRPGGHAIWVTKDFVRKGERVPFSDQWLAMCESIGFRLVCRHQAMLVKHGDRQRLLDGGEHQRTRERKSFFRRLAEKKGSPRIDWEDVICVRRS